MKPIRRSLSSRIRSHLLVVTGHKQTISGGRGIVQVVRASRDAVWRHGRYRYYHGCVWLPAVCVSSFLPSLYRCLLLFPRSAAASVSPTVLSHFFRSPFSDCSGRSGYRHPGRQGHDELVFPFCCLLPSPQTIYMC